MLTDENIEIIAEVAVQENSRVEEQNTRIPQIRDRLHETQLSLTNLTKALETGVTPVTVINRIAELEKEHKRLAADLKQEQRNVPYIYKALIIHWLEQFKGANIEDVEIQRILVDMLVNKVTVWDEPDGYFTIQINYNLTGVQAKKYRLDKDDTKVSDEVFKGGGMVALYAGGRALSRHLLHLPGQQQILVGCGYRALMMLNKANDRR